MVILIQTRSHLTNLTDYDRIELLSRHVLDQNLWSPFVFDVDSYEVMEAVELVDYVAFVAIGRN